MTQDFDLSITICSWNTVDDLRKCLESLREAQGEANFEVIVVDNASQDGSPDMVEREFPDFRLLRQSSNLGFTGGHNLAIKARVARNVALLNSDTIVHKGALGSIVAYMADRPAVGVLGPKLLNPDGSLQFSCRRFPNPVAAAFRNTVLGKLFPNNRFVKTYLMQDFDHSAVQKVDWVSGAAMFIRGELIDKIGGLDPDYFMYCEDTDFCFRAHTANFDVVYFPQAVITHAIGRSTDRAANKMIVRFHKSMLLFYRKNTLAKTWAPIKWVLLVLAAGALAVRASLFLSKNFWDAFMRRVRRR